MNNMFLKSIKKHFFKYFTSSIICGGIGVIANKYYSYAFSPEEYGVMALYLSFATYLQGLMAFSVDSSWQRAYFIYKDKRKNEFFSTIFIFILIAILLWLFFLVLFSDFLNNVLANNIWLYYMAISVAILTIVVKVFNILAYNEMLSGLFMKQNIFQSIVNNITSFSLVELFNFSIIARFIGQIIGYTANIFLLYKFFLQHNLIASVKLIYFRFDILKFVSKFSLPYFFIAVFGGVSTYIDKVFLLNFSGAQTLGIYSAGIIIGQIISTVIESLNNAIFPVVMTSLKEEYEQNIKKLKKIDTIWIIVLLIIGIILYLCRDILIIIFSNNSYSDASKILPLIILAYICGGCYKNCLNVLLYHNKVYYLPFATVISSIVGIIINYLLIPKYGAIGAAFAFFMVAYVYGLLVHIISCDFYFNYKKIIYLYTIVFIIGILFLYS